MTSMDDYKYFISSMRHRCHSYYLFRCSFCAATGWLLFEGGDYFFGKPWDMTEWWLDKVRTSEMVMVARRCQYSKRSLSVLLSVVGTTCTTQIVLALAWWPLSQIICTCVCMPHWLAAATIRGHITFKSFGLCGYYSRAATIQGWHLFKKIWYIESNNAHTK